MTRRRDDRTVGRRRALHLSARSVVGPRLVAHLSAGRARSRDDFEATLRSRQGDVPLPRRRLRDPAAGHGVRRKTTSRCGGCRSPTAAIGRARSRSRATPRSCSARPEDDCAHPAFGKLFVETEFDAQSAGILFSRRPRGADEAPRSGPSTCSASRGASAAPSSGRPIARASSAAAARLGRSGGARRPGAVGHDRRRARSRSRRCAIASASRPGAFVRVTFATGVAPNARRRARRSRASTATAASRRAPSRWRSRTRTSRCSTSASPTTRRCSSIASRRASSAPTPRASARRSRAQHARPVEPLGLRHLRRSADRARADHRSRVDSARAPAAARAGVLAASRACAPTSSSSTSTRRISRRDAGVPDAARAGAALGGLEQHAGRHVPAARRRHARGRSPPARGGRARRAARRSRRPRAAARSPGAVALSRPATSRRRSTLTVAAAGRQRRRGAAARHGQRPRRLHGRRPRVRRSCSTAIARRRCRGRT